MARSLHQPTNQFDSLIAYSRRALLGLLILGLAACSGGGGDSTPLNSFTKLDANGNPLAASATEWICVRDNVTGLIWEVKTTDGGLRDSNNNYTWYNLNSATNGGLAGTQNGGICTGSDCDTHAFVQAVNTQGLCGASDWRLPTVNELHSITHLGRNSPAIDTGFFPNTPPSIFWSASPYAGSSDHAWDVSFIAGHHGLGNKSGIESNNNRVRLVRGGQ